MPSSSSSPPKRMPKGLQIAIGAVAIVGLLAWYGWSRLEDGLSLQYFQTLDEFNAQAPALVGRTARVHGYVAESSIERNVASRTVRFQVQNDPPHAGGARGDTLTVVYQSLETPDMFKDGAEVVVEGQLVSDRGRPIFQATNVMAKCPSKFRAQAGPATEPSIEL